MVGGMSEGDGCVWAVGEGNGVGQLWRSRLALVSKG
jgi:hypothetical protein